MSKNIVPEILRFVSMLFLIFEKAMSKKLRQLFSDSYAFFKIFEKAMSKNIAPGVLRLVSMLFLIFEKAMRKQLRQVFTDS